MLNANIEQILSKMKLRNPSNPELLDIAKNLHTCRVIDISHLLNNGNFLSVGGFNEVLSFRFIDKSMPETYYVMEYSDGIGRTVEKTNEWKPLSLDFEYPFIKEEIPDRWEQETVGIFGTGNYRFVKGSINKKPDFESVANMIEQAINKFKIINLKTKLGY